jgi:hypothetical protein
MNDQTGPFGNNPQRLPPQGQPPRINPPSSQPSLRPAAPPAPPKKESDSDPIGLVDSPGGDTGTSKIRAFSGGNLGAEKNYGRKTNVTGTGICRVRTFHGRLSEEGMAYLDSKINEWLDHHQDIEIKQVTTCIGQFEGKIREQALVVNVWY